MSKVNNTLIKIEDFKTECENHEQLSMALLTLIETSKNIDAIKIIANEVMEQANSINSLSRFIKE